MSRMWYRLVSIRGLVILAATSSVTAHAAIFPTPSPSDRRVAFVDYKSDDVIVIATSLGVVTRIVLGHDEKILRAPDTGFPSNCDEPSLEWCIRAETGQNQITVKPRKGATQNNVEVSTDKRDYSFVLHRMDGAEKSKNVFYRVILRHPMPVPPSSHVSLVPAAGTGAEAASSAMDGPSAKTPADAKARNYPRPSVRNVSYSVKAEGNAASLLPSVIFDDGRFTYLKFPRAVEVPAVFVVDDSGQEVRVAFHSERLLADPNQPGDEVENDYLVIRRVARSLRLRMGTLVAEVINDRFDAQGIETFNGTTTPMLRREAKP